MWYSPSFTHIFMTFIACKFSLRKIYVSQFSYCLIYTDHMYFYYLGREKSHKIVLIRNTLNDEVPSYRVKLTTSFGTDHFQVPEN